jgi:hypothetical protein
MALLSEYKKKMNADR